MKLAPRAALLGVLWALGQGAATAAESDDATPLDDITVTASKREESSRAVPAGVTAIGGERLDAVGATRLEDYFALVPGLTFEKQANGGGNQVNLRGVTTGTDNSATVGLYVDDAPVGSSSAYAGGDRMTDFLASDLERLEVLRGPQGTLYGASTLGGLVKFVTRDPEAGAWRGSVHHEMGDIAHGGFTYQTRGVLNVPMGNDWATRLSGSHRASDGYIDSWRTARADTNSATDDSYRLVTMGPLTDGLTMRLSGISHHSTTDGLSYADYDFRTGQATPDYYQHDNRFAETSADTLDLGNLAFSWALPVGELKSVTTYQDLGHRVNQDASNLYGTLLATADPVDLAFDFDTQKWTQEFRLASPQASRLRWTAGLFYTGEDSGISAHILDRAANDGSYMGTGLRIYDADLATKYQEYAAFGDLGWRFTEAFDVAIGGRWAHNAQEFRQVSNGLADPGFPLGSDIPGESSESVFTWLVNPRYRLDRQSIAYVRVASGYRPGGPNVVTGAGSAPASFKADTLVNYEAGLKSAFMDGNLVLDADLFYIGWKDVQLAVQRNGYNSRENGGTARSQGAELSALYRAASFMTLTLSGACIDARLTEDAPQAGGKDGESLPNVPNVAATLGADFSMSLSHEVRGVANLSVHHVGQRDSYFGGNPSRPDWHLPSYETVDVRAGIERGPWSVALFGKNLLDERGQMAASTQGPGLDLALGQPVTAPVNVVLAEPRTLGASFGFRFE